MQNGRRAVMLNAAPTLPDPTGFGTQRHRQLHVDIFAKAAEAITSRQTSVPIGATVLVSHLVCCDLPCVCLVARALYARPCALFESCPAASIADEENAVSRNRDLRSCRGMAIALGALDRKSVV